MIKSMAFVETHQVETTYNVGCIGDDDVEMFVTVKKVEDRNSGHEQFFFEVDGSDNDPCRLTDDDKAAIKDFIKGEGL